jgi:hypothetical protein
MTAADSRAAASELDQAAARARRMMRWAPAPVYWPCACPGRCLHGEPCPNCRQGRLIHQDRSPDGQDPVRWVEWYGCANLACSTTPQRYTAVHLDWPWGYHRPDGGLAVFSGVECPAYDRPDTYPR